MKILRLLPALLCFIHGVSAQTIGGDAVYNFLKLAPSAQLSALGGINVSLTGDVSMAYANPALLTDSLHGQVSTNFNIMFAGIKNYFATTAWHAKKISTAFSASVNFFSYGDAIQTDPSGNILGNFKPHDFVIQLTAGRAYGNNWNYGASVKAIISEYSTYASNAIAMDFGVRYLDKSGRTTIGFCAKNMGFQVKAYGNHKEDLPFDLQVGISQKLHFPLSISVTAHRLHQFSIKNFVLAARMFLGEKFDISLGYDNVRNRELSLSNASNGLTGFSFGGGLHFSMLQIRYARGYYQSASAFNQFGINFKL